MYMYPADAPTIGPYVFLNVKAVGDRDTIEAIEYVRSLPDKESYVTAVVGRFDGLALLQGPPKRDTPGIHLRTPICGYDGHGPRATAEILALLGFGGESELFLQIISIDGFCFNR